MVYVHEDEVVAVVVVVYGVDELGVVVVVVVYEDHESVLGVGDAV